MEQQRDMIGMLDLMTAPAFSAVQGIVSRVNPSAQGLMIQPGTPVAHMLASGKEEYETFTGGCLYLELSLGGNPWIASVIRIADVDVFVLEPEGAGPELTSLALAARELREPLSAVISMAQKLYDSDRSEEAALLNKSLYRLLRLTGNMADAGGLSHLPRQETVNLTAAVAELADKAQTSLARCGIDLEFRCRDEDLFCLVDMPLVERAFWNMISNATKFTEPGGKVTVTLTRKNQRVLLSIQDNGCGIRQELLPTAFTRYLRQPGIEDSRQGLGLGMVLVRSAARQHGGTVLIDRPPEGGTRVTLTMELRRNTENILRSPILFADYCGERDHALVELADLLPPELYENLF